MSHLDFEIVSDFDIRISSLCYINSTNSYVRIYKQIMQNKPNFAKAKMNVSFYSTMNYKDFIPLAGQKNKPNSNPIKPNFFKGQNELKIAYKKIWPHISTNQKKIWTIPNEVVKISFLDELSISDLC